MNIINYLLIGAVVQVIITAFRCALGKWDPRDIKHDTFIETMWYAFWDFIAFIPFAVVNIILWPLTIVAEIHNFIKGI